MKNKYLEIIDCETHYIVIPKKKDVPIATIEPNLKWKKWVLSPIDGSYFTSDCLQFIKEFMEGLPLPEL